MKRRSRWPVRFDIEGVPRDVTLRQQKIEEQEMQFSKVQKPAPKDRNKPPAEPYIYLEYPKRIYVGKSSIVVADRAAEEKAQAQAAAVPAAKPETASNEEKPGKKK